jgi:hypothetical protein
MIGIFGRMKKFELKGEDKLERALFFVKGERCYLLHEIGATIEADLEGCCGRDSEAGPWTELPKEEGLWIWEGTPGWSSGVTGEGIDEGGDPIYEGRGKARRPNSEELSLITFGPIEKLWGGPQLRMALTKLCSKHQSGEDPLCDICYPLVNPPEHQPCPECDDAGDLPGTAYICGCGRKCTTCGLPMSDPNHDGKGGPPACPGPSAK